MQWPYRGRRPQDRLCLYMLNVPLTICSRDVVAAYIQISYADGPLTTKTALCTSDSKEQGPAYMMLIAIVRRIPYFPGTPIRLMGYRIRPQFSYFKSVSWCVACGR